MPERPFCRRVDALVPTPYTTSPRASRRSNASLLTPSTQIPHRPSPSRVGDANRSPQPVHGGKRLARGYRRLRPISTRPDALDSALIKNVPHGLRGEREPSRNLGHGLVPLVHRANRIGL